jgi:hypothetical protein
MSDSDRPADRVARNLDILEAHLAMKAAWGDRAPEADILAKIGQMRTRGWAIPDAEIAELLWSDLQLVNGKLTEAFELLQGSIQALTAPSRAARAKGQAHILRAKTLGLRGLSAAQIGVRMGDEDGRPEPYAVRVVRRWLATKG